MSVDPIFRQIDIFLEDEERDEDFYNAQEESDIYEAERDI